jgi:hypothetical protein
MLRPITEPVLIVMVALASWRQSSAQSKPPYRVIPLPGSGYSATAIDNSHLKVAPESSKPLLWLALVSSETKVLRNNSGYAHQDVNTLAVYDSPFMGRHQGAGIASDDSYLGGAGSMFPVRNPTQHLSVEFDNVTLNLDLLTQDGRMFVMGAKYELRCGGFTGFAQLKHLNTWRGRVEGGIEIPKTGFVELDVPNPRTQEPLAPGENEQYRSMECAPAVFGGDLPYFDFDVRPSDPDALVYLSGKYLGTAGSPFRTSLNPVDIVIRKQGYPDIAKRVYLHDGPNYLEISFPVSPARKAK